MLQLRDMPCRTRGRAGDGGPAPVVGTHGEQLGLGAEEDSSSRDRTRSMGNNCSLKEEGRMHGCIPWEMTKGQEAERQQRQFQLDFGEDARACGVLQQAGRGSDKILICFL